MYYACDDLTLLQTPSSPQRHRGGREEKASPPTHKGTRGTEGVKCRVPDVRCRRGGRGVRRRVSGFLHLFSTLTPDPRHPKPGLIPLCGPGVLAENSPAGGGTGVSPRGPYPRFGRAPGHGMRPNGPFWRKKKVECPLFFPGMSGPLDLVTYNEKLSLTPPMGIEDIGTR